MDLLLSTRSACKTKRFDCDLVTRLNAAKGEGGSYERWRLCCLRQGGCRGYGLQSWKEKKGGGGREPDRVMLQSGATSRDTYLCDF